MSRFDHGVHREKKINNSAAGLLPPLVFHDSASFFRVEARGHVVGKLGRVPRMIGEFSRMIGGT